MTSHALLDPHSPDFPAAGPRRAGWLALGIAVLITLLYLPSLTRYPAVHVDEPWLGNQTWNYVTTGDTQSTIDMGPRGENKGIVARPVFTLIFSVPYRLFGLGLWQTRLPAVVFGIVLLWLTFAVGRLLYSAVAGLLAEALLGTSPFFLLSSHLGRPDIVLSAFVMLSLACLLLGVRSGRLIWHSLAGFLIALAFEVHQNAVIFFFALAASYLVVWGWRVGRRKEIWAFAGGLVLGAALYGTLAVIVKAALGLLFPQLQVAGQNLATVQSVSSTHRPPIANPSPVHLLQSFVAEVYFRFHPLQNPAEVLAIALSALFLLRRRTHSDRLLLVFAGVAFLLFGLLLQNKVDHYTILLYPALMLMVASTWLAGWQKARTPRVRVIWALLLAVLLVGGAVKNAYSLYTYRNYDYNTIIKPLRAQMPIGSRVMARPTLWLGLADYNFRSTFTLTDYHYLRGYTLEQGLAAFRPDYLIIEDGLRRILVDSDFAPADAEGKSTLTLPRQDLERFLQQQGTLVLRFDNPWHGPVEVYRIRW